MHGQATGIVPLGGNKVMTLHAVRRDTDRPGIYACVAEIIDGTFTPICTELIWEPATPFARSKFTAEIFEISTRKMRTNVL